MPNKTNIQLEELVNGDIMAYKANEQVDSIILPSTIMTVDEIKETWGIDLNDST